MPAIAKPLRNYTVSLQMWDDHLDELDLRKATPACLVGGRGPKVSSQLKKTAA